MSDLIRGAIASTLGVVCREASATEWCVLSRWVTGDVVHVVNETLGFKPGLYVRPGCWSAFVEQLEHAGVALREDPCVR